MNVNDLYAEKGGKKQPAGRCWGYVLVETINNAIGLNMDLEIRHFLLEKQY